MSKKPLTDRSLRAMKTRKKLFQSAAKLVDKHGYNNVTIEDICRKAGVSVGAFYHYFNTKSDIIVELFRQIDNYYEENVTPKLSGDASADIEIFFRYYAQFHIEHGYEHTSMILKIQNDLFLDRSRYMHILLHRLVEGANASGVFGEGADPEVIADYMLVIARGLLFDWALARGEHDLVDKMGRYIKLAIRSFA